MTSSHEAPLDILRERPDLLLELLRLAGDATAEENLIAELVDPEVTVPAAHRADIVSILRDGRGGTNRVVVVEVQRARLEKKIRAWALYLAYLGVRHKGAPVTLLVVALKRRVSAWARKPRSLGSLLLAPLVIGPDDLPELRTGWRANLPLAIFTALAHNESPSRGQRGEREREEVLQVFEAVAVLADEARRKHYLSLIHGTAPADFRAILDKVLEGYGMSALEAIFNKGKAEGEAKGLAKGEAKGKAEALLDLLRERGFEVDQATELRVRTETDLAQLEAWLRRVLRAARLEDVFA